jgi:hypothetical protein
VLTDTNLTLFKAYADSNIDGHDLKGMDFTKEFLQNALHVQCAVAGTDRQTMSSDLLQHCPDATTWFDNPDDEEFGPKFNLMRLSKFKRRLEKLKEAAEKKARHKKRGKGNKRVRPDSSDKGSGGPSKKKKKSRKSKKELASSDLDESSDSSSDGNSLSCISSSVN